MKIRYTEELLKEVVQEQIYPEAAKEIAEVPLDHQVIAVSQKLNGEKTLASCILDVNEEGLLVVIMHLFRADKAMAYQFLAFSTIERIKVKKRLFDFKLTLQFTEGSKHVFKIIKRSMKHLPNQDRNIEYIISKLEERII